MNVSSLVAIGMLGIACGGPPRIQSTPAPPGGGKRSPGPPLDGRTISTPAAEDFQDLTFVAPRRALVSNGWTVTLIDTAGGTSIGSPVELSSSAMGRSGQPLHIVNEMRWTWVGGEPLALVRVWASVDAPPAGVGVWRPLREPAPGYIAGTNDVDNLHCKPAAFAPDGSMVALVGCDRAKPNISDIRLIDTASRHESATVTVPADAVDAVFAVDGKHVALATKNNEVGIYDIARRATQTLAGPRESPISSLAMRAEEPRLAAGNDDNQVVVWNTATGTHSVLARQGKYVAFSPDGRTLAIGGYGTLALVDTATWSMARELVLHRDTAIRKIAWSPDGAQLAVLAYNTGLIVFDVRSTAEPPVPDDSWWARIKPVPSPAEGPPPPGNGSIQGVVTLAGKPVVGLELTLHAQREAPASVRRSPPPVARTDKTGAFRFDNVYRERWECRIATAGAEISSFGADLREKQTSTLRLELQPAVTLVGRVVDPAGKLVAGARVHHMRYDGLDLDVVTDADGGFTRDHMPPAPMSPGVNGPRRGYIIDVDRADGSVAQVELDLSQPGRRELSIKLLPPTDPRVVKLIVVDTAGKPVPNATVIANEMYSRVTDARGRVSIIWNEREISVRAMGTGGNTRQQVSIPMPHAAPVTLTLEP